MIKKFTTSLAGHWTHHWGRTKHHLRDHFIPHAGNNHHPHVLRHHVLFGYTAILILLKVIVVVAPIALPSSSLFSSAITAKNIIDLTNQERANVNLPALTPNDLLAQAAANKAADMLAHQYFAHTSPAGATPWQWIKGVGYRYQHAGENLAVHFIEAEAVEAGWMASPTHRANIVSDKYDEIGVGVVTGNFEGVASTFVVQLFGRPATSTVAAASVPTPNPTPVRQVVATTAGEVAGVDAPKPAPTPVPASEPVVPVSAPKKIVELPTLNDSSVVITPSLSAYAVRVEAHHAIVVTAHLSGAETNLTPVGQTNTWEGVIAYDKNVIPNNGDTLTLSATGEGGTVSIPVALVAPATETQQLYVFNESTDRVTKLFGFLRITNLNDSVRSFYMGFMVFLGAALLLSIFAARLKLHHPSVVSHALAVLVLAVFLSVV